MVYAILVLSALSAGGFAAAAGWFDTWNALWQVPLCFAGSFIGFVVLFLLVLLLSAMIFKLLPTPKKPSAWFRFLIGAFCQLVFSLANVHVHITGTENVPTSGRFMLVSNHLFAYDPALIYYALPGKVMSFISKKEVETFPVVSDFLRALLCLPIDRENDRAALKTILQAIDLLKRDITSIAVFPEGGTSKDGKLQPMRNGVFKIAQKAQVPIVVCVLDKTPLIFKNMFRRRTDVTFDVLQTIIPEEYADMATVEIGERVHEIMRQRIAELEKNV
ncbi:MAG: 1-acyl-sn-glycerol-3-phosphate acyltransferase [Oscillospiraceae bacterium]|nr:1-acyl-sn-glycerol-3-phosphate acyltransferase [Oscillospiraceae bacterium]